MAGKDFNCADQGAWAWVQRSEVCVELLVDLFGSAATIAIADVGCGDAKLQRLLESRGLSWWYKGYDIRPQSDSVVAFDVLKDELPLGSDVVVMLGVIEYLEHLPAVLMALSLRVPHLVISHVIKQSSEYTEQRRLELGWINHLSREELLSCLQGAGFEVIQHRMDKENKTILVSCRSVKSGDMGISTV